jgi:plastocyanin
MRTRSLSSPGRVLIGILALLTPVAVSAAANPAHAVPAPQDWTVLVGSQTPDMAVQGQRFLPGDITIDAGDSVTWQANSAEIHTVTFVDGGTPQPALPPLDPTDPTQITPQGPATMAPATDFNSGLLTTLPSFTPLPVPVFTSYTLTFPDAGTFTYYCLVHGVMMRGVVHVQAAGAAYPATQADIDADAAWLAGAINADGRALQASALAASTNHKVFTGADNGVSMVMRFLRHKVVIHKGEKVRFVNNMSMGAPHTVTFGAVPAGLGLFAPSGHPTNYRGGDLNSGILPPHSSFLVTFNKVGRFHYLCGLHRDMNMKGVVVVKP